MANRDGARNRQRRKKPTPVKKTAPAADTTVEAKPAPASPEKARSKGPVASKPKVNAPPRRPIQIAVDDKGFWVFCDDGSICVGRMKKGTIKWTELGPPLPGSPADRREAVSVELSEPT